VDGFVTSRLYGKVFADNDLPTETAHLTSKSLGTVDAASELAFKKHLHGTDELRIKINRHHPQADLLQKDRFFVVYSSIGPVGGAFLEEAPVDLSADGGPSDEWMEWTGRGSIAVLERGAMDNTSGIGDDPIDGFWDLSNQGDFAGASNGHPIPMMKRVLNELDTNIPNGIAVVDHSSWDYDADSASATPPFWGEIVYGVDTGEDALSIAANMSQLGGVVWDMDYLFNFNAYLTFGTDRSGAFGAAGKVRFEKGVNVAAAITRKVRGAVTRTHLIVGGAENTFVTVVDPDYVSGDVVRYGFLGVPETADTDALEEAGLAHIALRKRQTDSWSFPLHDHGDSIANGIYEPGRPGTSGAHFWVGDRVTLHSGSGEYDADEEVVPIAAITWQLKTGAEANGDYWVIPEVGSTFHWSAASVQNAGTPGSQRRLLFCEPTSVTDRLSGIVSGSIKVSGEFSGAERTKANDGDDDTTWSPGDDSGGPVAESYWAADLGSALAVDAYRIRQMGGSAPNIQNVATEVRIYGSNDADAWTWLPSGVIAADPAANDWTLVETYTGALALNDTGHVSLVSEQTFRYWLFRAVTGGTSDWDVETFQLLAHTGNAPQPVGANDEAASGTSNRAVRCDHVHAHSDLSDHPDETHHALPSITTTETDTSLRLAPNGTGGTEWAETEAGGSSTVRIPHLNTGLIFPIITHHGDTNATDGYPENSLEAYLQGSKRGVHGHEIDVLLSADGTWYCSHDLTVDRTTSSTGTFASKSDATINALRYDGGTGYRSGDHGSTIAIPTLDAVLDAVMPGDPILWLDLKEGGTGAGHATAATTLAQYVVANSLQERTIILVWTLAAAAAVKAVDSTLEVAMVIYSGFDSEDANVDRLYSAHDYTTSAAFVDGRQPKPVDAWPHNLVGDERATMLNMWTYGARSWTTDNLPEALQYRQEIVEGVPYLVGGEIPAAFIPADSHDHDADYADIAHTHGATGPILIADDHSTPLVFADLLQNEDGDGFIYGDS
jgi:glycerophosphoryl diester phosphodiesterase